MLALLAAFCLWLLGGTAFSFVWLLILLGAPWLSLGLSIPAIRSFHLRIQGRRSILMGGFGQLMLLGACKYPMPPFRGRLRLYDEMTGKKTWYDPSSGVPTGHCGGCRAELKRGRVCDYLGLWSFPCRAADDLHITVMPKPVEIAGLPDFSSPPLHCYRAGGDSPEEYELSAYRRGDSPKSLHWKLSFKTGHPIVRRLHRPEPQRLTVDMLSVGSRADLDRKFGQILWLSRHLLSRGIPHRLRVLNGRGVCLWEIGDTADLHRALSSLVCFPPAKPGQSLPADGGTWHYMPGDDG